MKEYLIVFVIITICVVVLLLAFIGLLAILEEGSKNDNLFADISSFISKTPTKEEVKDVGRSLGRRAISLETLLLETNLKLNRIKFTLNYLQKEGIVKKYTSNNNEVVYSLQSVYLKQLENLFE